MEVGWICLNLSGMHLRFFFAFCLLPGLHAVIDKTAFSEGNKVLATKGAYRNKGYTHNFFLLAIFSKHRVFPLSHYSLKIWCKKSITVALQLSVATQNMPFSASRLLRKANRKSVFLNEFDISLGPIFYH